MKVVLVDIDIGRWCPGSYQRTSILEPYSIESLGASLRDEGVEVVLLLFQNNNSLEIASSILSQSPDIVGFSVLTKSFNISRVVAKKIKNISSDTLIIFGGSHPSLMPEIVQLNEIDIIVIGEGERVLIDIVKAVIKGESYKNVKGIAYWENGLRITSLQHRIRNLDGLPWPIRVKEWMKKSRPALPIYPSKNERNGTAQITYSRGCKYKCTFCASPMMWRHVVLWRSAKEVVKEVKYLRDTYDINFLYFTDLTFNFSPLKVYELCDEFIKQEVKINWSCDFRFLESTPSDMFMRIANAGCSRIAWGIESVSDNTLSRIMKKQSLRLISHLLKLSNQAGIINRAFLIIGFPWETKEDMIKIPEILRNLPIDSLKILFLTPFPGTPIYEQYKDLLITDNFDHFTTDEPVLSVPNLSKENLIEIRMTILKKFYDSAEYINHWKMKVKKFPHLRKSYDEFFSFLSNHNFPYNDSGLLLKTSAKKYESIDSK